MIAERVWPVLFAGTALLTGCTAGGAKRGEGASEGPLIEVTGAVPADPRTEVLVRVVNRETQAPIAGARVSYDTAALMDLESSRRQMNATGVPREFFFGGTGCVALTDQRGEAHIPRPHLPMRIEARQGDLWNDAMLDPNVDEPFVVQLDDDVSTSAVLLDESGQPIVGAFVYLFAVQSDGKTEQPVSVARSRAPDGFVEIAHYQEARRLGGSPAELRIRALLPGAIDAQLVDVRWGISPNSEWSLIAPTSGSVVVHVHRRDHSPEPNALVHLACFDLGQARFDADTTTQGSDCVDGVAVYSDVALGKIVNVVALAADGSKRTRLEFEGPRNPGEAVHVDLEFGDPLPSLTGRLVDACGEPFRWCEFQVKPMNGPSLPVSRSSFVTDGQGRFHVYLDGDGSKSRDGATPLQFAVRRTATPEDLVGGLPLLDVPQQCGEPACLAVVTRNVQLPTPGDDVDLGDLVLGLGPR
jgi:hypothetical protein